MNIVSTVDFTRRESDPALLAFIKCHISSVAKWDVLCVLARHIDRWYTPDEVAHELSMPTPKVSLALSELANDGVLDMDKIGLGMAYRVPADEPSTVVVERLFNAARVDQNLRRIVIARMLAGSSS
jgi:hypothetical protein